MFIRISIRWTSLPSFLRPGIISSSSDSTCSCTRRLFSHMCGLQKDSLRTFIFLAVNRTRRFASTDFYEHGADSHHHYGIVIDCGSSGSRVFIYYWPPHNGNPDELLQIKQMKDTRGNPVRMKIKPGIIFRTDSMNYICSISSPCLLVFRCTLP